MLYFVTVLKKPLANSSPFFFCLTDSQIVQSCYRVCQAFAAGSLRCAEQGSHDL